MLWRSWNARQFGSTMSSLKPDKYQKRAFQEFTDPQQEVRKMLKEIADPSGVFPFSSKRDPRISAVHCFGYHSKLVDMC